MGPRDAEQVQVGADLRATQEKVEQVIRDLGLSPDKSFLHDERGTLGWGLMRGSAHVYVSVRPHATDSPFHVIQVIAPLIHLPTDAELQLSLFRRLLELNAQEVTGAAFAIRDDMVVIVADRSTRDLDCSEVKAMVLSVGFFADVYDDALASQFGGRRYVD